MGDETQANRQRREADRVIERKVRDLTAQKEQTKLATDERDQARRELTTAQARILELEQAAPPDCSAAVKADRARLLEALSNGIDDLLAQVEA